jgi:hypothetical protein
VLRKINQTQKDKYHVSSHVWSLDFLKKHCESRRGAIGGGHYLRKKEDKNG